VWAAVGAAGPWAAFLGMCLGIVIAYQRDWVISLAEYKRREVEHERAIAAEQRIAAYHEKRAEVETERADRAVAQLATLASALPEALRQIRGGS